MEPLLNWLVQGTGLTLIVVAGVGACRHLNAATRERIWWITLGAVLAIPFVGGLRATPVTSSTLVPSIGPEPLLALPPLWSISGLIVVTVCAGWAGIRLTRLGVDLFRVLSAKRHALPLAPYLEERLVRWGQSRARGRAVRLVLSERVHHAAVLGFRDPVIAIAPETIGQLSDEQLDQVIAHEYAHVQRWDDVAALVQSLISAVTGLHPAVWWLDRALTIEREVACDDWVLSNNDEPKSYGACLVKLAGISRQRQVRTAPGVALLGSELEIRITRLLDCSRNASVQLSRSALLIAAPVVGCVTLACLGFELFGPAIGLPTGPFRSQLEGIALIGSPPPGTAVNPAEVLNRTTAPTPLRRALTRQALPPRDQDVVAIAIATAPVDRNEDPAYPGEPLAADTRTIVNAWPTGPLPDEAPTVVADQTVVASQPAELAATSTTGSPWSAVAASGVAATRRAQDTAVATARIFSHLGKSVGAAFRVSIAQSLRGPDEAP